MESFDAWKLVSLSPLPSWVRIVLAMASGGGVVLACWGVRKEAQVWRRWLLWALRILAGACVLFFLFEPGVRHSQLAQGKSRVHMLVDRSASMGFPVDRQGPTRSEAVARAFERLSGKMDALESEYVFELYGFSPELQPVTADALRSKRPIGSHSHLLSALHAVQAGQSYKPSGCVLFSDGADNGELAEGLTDSHRARLERLGFPVTTVVVGENSLVDLAIVSIQADEFAFVRNSVNVDAQVRARGFRGKSVQVVLRNESHLLGTKTVTFSEESELQSVRFTFTPDQTGRFIYTMSVPVFQDETVVENNVMHFTMKVIRDRVRILLVSGRPTWDERFLRDALKQDANIELISFYILRSSTEASGATIEAKELSLIPFPKEEIFQTKIHTFDVIFVLNYDNDDAQTSLKNFRSNIETYIENGGALAYLGGDRSFWEARSRETPLDGVLPVTIAGPARLEAFAPKLTSDGQRHPITAMRFGNKSLQSAWAALPELPGMNLVRTKPGATVLLTHPSATVDGDLAPLLVVWQRGRGRALALATDASWYWAFTSHADGVPTRMYKRFWSNAIRWLVRDPDFTTLTVTVESAYVELGHSVGVMVGARFANYEPAVGANVVVHLASAENKKILAQATALTGSDGTARIELTPPGPGAYKVHGRASKDGMSLGENTDAVIVRAVGRELSDTRVNSALLVHLAHVTGGASFTLSDFSLSDVPLLEPPFVEVGRSSDLPLWPRWYYLMCLVLVLGAEWIIRRRHGYV